MLPSNLSILQLKKRPVSSNKWKFLVEMEDFPQSRKETDQYIVVEILHQYLPKMTTCPSPSPVGLGKATWEARSRSPTSLKSLPTTSSAQLQGCHIPLDCPVTLVWDDRSKMTLHKTARKLGDWGGDGGGLYQHLTLEPEQQPPCSCLITTANFLNKHNTTCYY